MAAGVPHRAGSASCDAGQPGWTEDWTLTATRPERTHIQGTLAWDHPDADLLATFELDLDNHLWMGHATGTLTVTTPACTDTADTAGSADCPDDPLPADTYTFETSLRAASSQR